MPVRKCVTCDVRTSRGICVSCVNSQPKQKSAATPQEKKNSLAAPLKLFEIKVYTKVSVNKSILLEVDKEAAMTYARLGPEDRQEVREIEGPFKAGFIIHNGWI